MTSSLTFLNHAIQSCIADGLMPVDHVDCVGNLYYVYASAGFGSEGRDFVFADMQTALAFVNEFHK